MMLSLAVPFYNEERKIVRGYQKISAFLKKQKISYELLMIDDGSTDNSLEKIRPFQSRDTHLRVINSFPNRGRGYVLNKAFSQAKGNFIGHLDADLEISLLYLKKALEILRKGKADLVIASKNHPRSRVKASFFRKVAAKIYGFLMKIILGLSLYSYQSGLKLFTREAVKRLSLLTTSHRWFWDTEILFWAQKAGFRIWEMPVSLSYGENSHTSPLKDAIEVVKEALILRWKEKDQ